MKVTRALLLLVLLASPLAIVAVLATSSDAAAGLTYYVAPNGSDNAAGTQTAPWASIAHAQTVVQAGDTVSLRGGTPTAPARARRPRSTRSR